MTRKQALSLAMQALSEIGEREEAVAVLRTMAEELPLVHWSDTAIRDSVEQFILDHGRVPTVSDFKKCGLPPHTVIKNRYGVTLQCWLEKNYPSNKPPMEEERKRLTKAFVDDYQRIRPQSAEEFNAKRTPGSPCWYTVAVHNHTKRWRELLKILNLPVYNHAAASRETIFKVNIFTHYDFRD